MPRISELLDRYSLYVALLAAWIAMLGSLYFSQVKGYIPCELCWYQRILMYPLTVVLGIGLLRKDENLPLLVLPLSSLGLLVGLYHYLLEKTNIFPAHACTGGVSCTAMWINWFGFVTIPFLSLTAFTIITLMCIVAWQAGEPINDPELGTPWLPVVAVVGLVCVVFATLFTMGRQNNLQAQLSQAAAASQATANTSTANQLYIQGCASCHGQKGEGVTGLGVSLANSDTVHMWNDRDLLAMIRAGRGLDDPNNTSKLVMPPSGGRPDFSDSEMLAIIKVIRAFQN